MSTSIPLISTKSRSLHGPPMTVIIPGVTSRFRNFQFALLSRKRRSLDLATQGPLKTSSEKHMELKKQVSLTCIKVHIAQMLFFFGKTTVQMIYTLGAYYIS